MKKNIMMRVASIMLIAVLLSTCTISGTFAKYVTTESANDSARVAKWGIVLQADGKLYGEQYKNLPLASSTDANITVQVVQSAKENVVAPGTENDKGMSFSINGTPEVKTRLDATITAQNIYLAIGNYAVMVKAPTVTATSFAPDTYYTKSGTAYTLATAYAAGTEYYTMQNYVELTETYYPVVYAADVTGTIAQDTINLIAEDYAKKLNDGVAVTPTTSGATTTYEVVNKEYPVHHNFADLGLADEKLTWAWAFEQGKNLEDTILGNLMAGDMGTAEVVKVTATSITAPTPVTDYNLSTSFSISISVTQVD